MGTLLAECVDGTEGPRERCAVFLLKEMNADGEAADPPYCLRPGTILGDVRARFIAWATVHEEFHASPADAGVRAALAEAFPCPLIQSG